MTARFVRDLPREEHDGDVMYASVVSADGENYTLSTLWRGQGKAFGCLPRGQDAKKYGQFRTVTEELYETIGENPTTARNCETALFAGHFEGPCDIIERHGFVWCEEDAQRRHMQTLEKFLEGAYQDFIRAVERS